MLVARRALPFVLALGAIVALIRLYRVVQRFDPAAERARVAAEGDLALAASDTYLVARVRGVPQWSLRADGLNLRRAPDADMDSFYAVELARIREGAVYRDGRKRASFEAGGATYERLMGRLDVAGPLQLVSADGDRFTSRRCVWTERQDVARFPEGGSASIGRNSVDAPLMLYDLRNRSLQCPQGASADIRGQTIQMAALTWDIERGFLRCGGPLAGSRDGMPFTAESAEIDLKAHTIRVNKGRMELRMDSGRPWEAD